MFLFFSFIISLFVTTVLMMPLSKLAVRYQLVDIPGNRKIHTEEIPRIGGIAMVLGTILPILMWVDLDRVTIAFLISMLIIFIFGIWDDRKNLGYRTKFFGQILAVLVVILYGGIQISRVPFFEAYSIPFFLSFPLTFFVLLGITNAINLADGLDGLAGGITLLSFGVIAVLGYLVDSIPVDIIAVAIMGSIFGFLRFNTYPARVFMGDSGSQFLGFSLGVLAIMLTQDVNTAVSSALPLLIIGLPLIDTMMVMTQRMYEGKSPFKADANHIHHKLLTRGFDHYEAVILIYLMQAILVASAYLLRYQSDLVVVGLFAVFCITLFIFVSWTKVTGWKFRKTKNNVSEHLVTKYINWITHESHLAKWINQFVIFAIMVYALIAMFGTNVVSYDIGVLSLALAGVSFVLLLRHYDKPLEYIERACVYVACTIIVYLVQTSQGSQEWLSIFLRMYFVIMAIAVVIGIRSSKFKRFELTPLDFLVVFIAFTVPNLPSVKVLEINLAFSIAILIITYYAIEMILNNMSAQHNIIRYTILISMGMLGIKGIV